MDRLVRFGSAGLGGMELKIASSFVKQYYTILNKAPCFISNFYSQNSTFIHGTTEMANEHYTEPIVGREKIKKKMEELKLNDCRAKIKQIDCLETLAGGLVIQVIGELSNNGKPMRRFLQTFVLAPSPDETRQDGDSQPSRSGVNDRRGVQVSENNSSSPNQQKFFVLNSIFRFQDDGPDSEFEDDAASLHANTSTGSTNGGNGASNEDNVNKSVSKQQQQQPPIEVESKPTEAPPNVVNKSVSNGTGNVDKKSETFEKPAENGDKTATEHPQVVTSSNNGPSVTTSQPTPPAVAPTRPQPSNEPKTWANMVRNAHPPSSTIQTNVMKNASTEPSQNQSSSQPSSVQTQQQQQQQQQPQQQQQQQQVHQQQQQPQQQSQAEQQQHQQAQPNSSSNNNNNNRRRHVIRKPSNKSTGRAVKNRPRPAPAGKPIA